MLLFIFVYFAFVRFSVFGLLISSEESVHLNSTINQFKKC